MIASHSKLQGNKVFLIFLITMMRLPTYLVVLNLSLVGEVKLGEGDAVLLPIGSPAGVQRKHPKVVPEYVVLAVYLDENIHPI